MNIGNRNDEHKRLAISANPLKLDHNDRIGGTSPQQQHAYSAASSNIQQHQPLLSAGTDFTGNLNMNYAWHDERLLREFLVHRGREKYADGNLTFHQATVDLLQYQMMAAAEGARLDAIAKLASMKKDNDDAHLLLDLANHGGNLTSNPPREGNKRKKNKWSPSLHRLKSTVDMTPELQKVHSKKMKYETFDLPMPTDDKTMTMSSHFPLPPWKEDPERNQKQPAVGKLSFFRKTWARLERQSDRMDDTAADQEAFIKEFFLRTVTSYESDHLKRKVVAMKRRDGNLQFPF